MKGIKVPLLYLLSFVVSIGPVAIYFFANRDAYIETAPQGVKLSCGIVLLLSVALLKSLGKLKFPSRTVLFALVFILCYLLGSVLNDLLVFSFLALVGEILDSICQVFIRRAKEERLSQKMAEKTADEIKKVLGRV